MRLLFVLAAAAAVFAATNTFAQAQTVVPLDLSAPRPMVTFEIDGAPPAKAIFDTGASGSAIDKPFAENLGLPNEFPARVGSGAGGGLIDAYGTTIRAMKIGEARLENVIAVVMELPKPPGHEEVVAILSPNVFAGKYLTLDFANAAMTVHEAEGATPRGELAEYEKGPRPLPAIPVTVGGIVHHAHVDTGAPRALTFPYEMASTLPLAGPLETAGTAHVVTGERISTKESSKASLQSARSCSRIQRLSFSKVWAA